MTTRRGFLGAMLVAGVAPAYVGASVLMPVRKIVVPIASTSAYPPWPSDAAPGTMWHNTERGHTYIRLGGQEGWMRI